VYAVPALGAPDSRQGGPWNPSLQAARSTREHNRHAVANGIGNTRAVAHELVRNAGEKLAGCGAEARRYRIPVIDADTARGSRIGHRPASTCVMNAPTMRLNSSGSSMLIA
jgi:hypothetical protein